MQGTTKVLKYYFKGYFRFGKICEIHLNESLVTSIHKFARYNTHTHTHTIQSQDLYKVPPAQKQKQGVGPSWGEAHLWGTRGQGSIFSLKTWARLFRANEGKVPSGQRTPCAKFKGVELVACWGTASNRCSCKGQVSWRLEGQKMESRQVDLSDPKSRF